MPILPYSHSNPLWPLPADYHQLDEMAKKAARVEVVTSWFDSENPRVLISDPKAFIVGFRFFREYYRKGWKGNRAKYSCESPKLHDEWTKQFAENQLLLLTAARGFGKSFWAGEELAEFVIVTRPHTPVQYTSAEEGLTTKQVRAVKLDLEQNPLIKRDFGDLTVGRRQGLMWTKDRIELSNGSSYLGVSSDSRQRGQTQLSLRAMLQILDDPEVDKRVKNPLLLSDFEDFLFNIFFPCAEPGAWRVWTNTLLSPHAWAMKASHHEDDRFDNWTALRYNAMFLNKQNEWESWWEDRFPVKMLKQMAGIEKAGKGVINYGKTAFATEFMNDPSLKGDPAFAYERERHTYTWQVDPNGKKWLILPEGKRVDYDELRKHSTCVMGLDVSLARTSHSDLSAIVVALLDSDGNLWVMESWTERVRPVDAVRKLFELGEKWQVAYLGVQKALLDLTLLDFMQDEITSRMMKRLYYFEVVELVGMGGPKKLEHLMSLQWRFDSNRIRLPIESNAPVPYGYGSPELEIQITGLTTVGSLKYDDLLDALVFCQDVGLRILQGSYQSAEKPKTVFDQVEEARKQGLSLQIPVGVMTPADLNRAIRASLDMGRELADNKQTMDSWSDDGFAYFGLEEVTG